VLASLYIRDLAIVREVELVPGGGFCVITGETGAGKSVLIDALGLLLGERADVGLIRDGAGQADVTAEFTLAGAGPAHAWLEAQELATDGACVLRRVLFRDRPNKAYINGRPVPAQSLREIGELLGDIHGQHEHQSLLRREVQREILDGYAGTTGEVAQLAEAWRRLRDARARLAQIEQRADERDARIEVLQFQVGELEPLDLSPGAWEDLEAEHARLAHAGELAEGTQAVLAGLYEGDDATAAGLLDSARARLESLSAFDPSLAEPARMIGDARIQVDEAVATLRSGLAGLEADPARLADLDARIGEWHALARKHRVPPTELAATRDQLVAELAELEHSGERGERLAREIDEALAAYRVLASRVGARRLATAARLSQEVTTHMQELGMGGGEFQASVVAQEDGEPTAHGLDRVEFLVSANPGQAPRPLGRVASGGELSRIALAIQVVTAAVGGVPTLVFDEVDAGIGGRVAEIVGDRLRRLGAHRQVMCITHLAQVAAQGHVHLRVEKSTGPELSVSVQVLDEGGRIEEIARMIGGRTITARTRDHARDMLARGAA